MIKLIYGAKGTGKTKIIVDMANDNVENAKGDIVFVTDTDELLHSLNYRIRIINTGCLKADNAAAISTAELIAFIKGILSSNYDIETLYLDGAHRMLQSKVPEMSEFYTALEKIVESSKVRFVLTVSEEPQNFPEVLKKYAK